MIAQTTAEQTRRVTRSRAYSGAGFGPHSFECFGLGFGLGLGMMAGGAPAPAPPDPLETLGAAAWWVRADDPGITIDTGVSLWPDKTGNIVGGSVVMPANTRCWVQIRRTIAGAFTQHSAGILL